MTPQEYFIGCLGEEGSEISQICSKINRFGINEVNKEKPDGPSNLDRLLEELNDIEATAAYLVEMGVLPDNWRDLNKQKGKILKLARWAEYSQSLGILDKDFEP